VLNAIKNTEGRSFVLKYNFFYYLSQFPKKFSPLLIYEKA